MLIGLFSLFGSFFPLFSEALQMHTLSSGVKVWIQENTVPSHMVSFRVIDEEKKYGIDVFLGDSRETDYFFTSIKQEATTPFQVIAVGDFDEKTLLTWMDNTLHDVPAFQKTEDASQIIIHENAECPQAEVSLSYPMKVLPISTEDSLKQFWSAAICRKLIEKRLEESLASIEAEWDGSGASFLFPQKTCRGKAVCDPVDCLVILTKFLSAVQEIRRAGFTALEWEEAKSDIINTVQVSLRLPPDSSTLATYFSEQIATGAALWPTYSFFVNSSVKALNELERPMVHQTAMAVIQDKERRIKYTGPSVVTEAEILEVLNGHRADQFEIPIVEEKITSESDEIALAAFSLMPVTESEEKLIWELVDNLGNKGYWDLLLIKSRMYEIQEKIQHIHPLRFLGIIYSDPYLKECMKKAFKKTLVKKNFIDGLRDNFLKEFPSNNVYPLIPGFCKKLGADPDQVNMLIQKHQWERLLRYLSRL